MRYIGRRALSGAMALLLAGALVPAAWADDDPQEVSGDTSLGEVDDKGQTDDGADVETNDATSSVGSSSVDAAVVSVPPEEGGSDVGGEPGSSLSSEVSSDTESSPQADTAVTATPGWELIGTCEWRIDEKKCLTIRPAENSEKGSLPEYANIDISAMPGGIEKYWPWNAAASNPNDGKPYDSVVFSGSIVSGETLECIFYGGEVKEIVGLSNLDTSNAKNMSYMFSGCSSLISLDVSSLDTSNVSDMSGMFNGLESLQELDLSCFDTSKVTDMSFMFGDMYNLKDLNLSNINTSKVTNMSYMFINCGALQRVDVSGFNTSNVVTMRGMFGCGEGEDWACDNVFVELDLSSFDTSNVTDMCGMFSYNKSLKSLDLSSFDTSNVSNMSCMFAECPNLTMLNLSSFDTKNVEEAWDMFGGGNYGDTPLQLVSLGGNFTLQDQLPDKTWYNQQGQSFAPSTIPVGVAGTYATSMDLFDSAASQTRVTLNETSKKMTVGDEPFKLVATVVADEAQDKTIEWTSSDSTVATVDADGVVKPVSVGGARITARSGLATAVCEVEVEPLAIGTTADSVVEAKILVQDSALAKQLDGYALRIIESAAKGSTAFEQALSGHAFGEGEFKGIITDVYDIDLVSVASGDVFDWTGSNHEVILEIKMDDRLKELAETHDFNVWYCDDSDGTWSFEKRNVEVYDGCLYFWTTHLSTYAVTATERPSDEAAAGTDSNTASSDKTSKKDAEKKGGDLAQTNDDMPARATLLLSLAGVSAFLLMLSVQNRRTGRRER